MYSYIIVSDTGPWKWCSNLGHELFFTRKIVLLLLFNKLINNDITIVTSYADRKFLYTHYFNNVLTYEEYLLKETNNNSLLNLSPYLLSLFAGPPEFYISIGSPNGKTINELKMLGLDKEYLTNNTIFQNTNTGLIGEWSGGSQLSHFCAKKVVYYYDNYPHSYFTNDVEKYKEGNDADFYSYWDHYNPIEAQRQFINRDQFLNKHKLLSLIR